MAPIAAVALGISVVVAAVAIAAAAAVDQNSCSTVGRGDRPHRYSCPSYWLF